MEKSKFDPQGSEGAVCIPRVRPDPHQQLPCGPRSPEQPTLKPSPAALWCMVNRYRFGACTVAVDKLPSGRMIRAGRALAGMEQLDLAREIGVDRRTVSRLEADME